MMIPVILMVFVMMENVNARMDMKEMEFNVDWVRNNMIQSNCIVKVCLSAVEQTTQTHLVSPSTATLSPTTVTVSASGNCIEGHNCHKNAQCIVTAAGFECVCNKGYRGDGMDCQGKHTNSIQWYNNVYVCYFRYR